MSETQIWLLVAGLAFLAGVFGYNKWQEAQLKRRADARFASRHEDVLLGAAPADGGAAPEAPEARAPAPVEHTLGLSTESAPRHTDAAGPVLDARIDFIATIEFSEPRLGEEILRNCDELEARVSKMLGWEGIDPVTGELGALSPSLYYRTVRAGLQLIDRSGPANEPELTGFCQGLQALAVNLLGRAEFGSRVEALRLTERLDEFCAEVDIVVGLSVVRRDGALIPGTRIRAIAEAEGCTLDADGRYVRLAEGGAERYALVNGEPRGFSTDVAGLATRSVSVQLDVPRAPESGTFKAYCGFAKRVAQALEGALVDDNRQPVSDAALEVIGNQVAAARTRLLEAGIPAGSPLGLRIFA